MRARPVCEGGLGLAFSLAPSSTVKGYGLMPGQGQESVGVKMRGPSPILKLTRLYDLSKGLRVSEPLFPRVNIGTAHRIV